MPVLCRIARTDNSGKYHHMARGAQPGKIWHLVDSVNGKYVLGMVTIVHRDATEKTALCDTGADSSVKR